MTQDDEDFLFQLITDLKGLDGESMNSFLEYCRENPIPGCMPENMEPQSNNDTQN